MAANSATVKSALSKCQENMLGLTSNDKTLGNGEHVPRMDAQKTPVMTLTLPGAGQNTYLAVCIDLDAPFKSLNFLSPILHYIQPDLKADQVGTLKAESDHLVKWGAPRPPPGAAAHRYVFYIYEQPADFDRAKFPAKRMRFDVEGFAKAHNLGEIVAASMFTSN